MLYQLQTPVEECTDSDALNAVAKHLQSAITAIKAKCSAKQILPIKRVYTANQNQNIFFSTKKRKVCKNDWAKTTLERIQGKAKLWIPSPVQFASNKMTAVTKML